jgi:SUKH-3 immunity protein of toxin-antitoxin system
MSRDGVEIDFPDDVRLPLEAAGWFRERRVLADRWIAPLEEEGNRCFPRARDFLERFGGLEFEALPYIERAFNPSRTLLDPLRAASGEFDRIEGWQKDHGLRLFPVGYAFGEYFILLIAPDETFYAGSDESFVLVGTGATDCFRQLLYAPRHLIVLEAPERR